MQNYPNQSSPILQQASICHVTIQNIFSVFDVYLSLCAHLEDHLVWVLFVGKREHGAEVALHEALLGVSTDGGEELLVDGNLVLLAHIRHRVVLQTTPQCYNIYDHKKEHNLQCTFQQVNNTTQHKFTNLALLKSL